MTILLWELALAPVNGTSSRWHNKIVIPTGAQRSGGTCGFFPLKCWLRELQVCICAALDLARHSNPQE